MPIVMEEEIVIPQKSFDKFWACRVEISAPSPNGEASAQVLLLPYNHLGETYPEGMKRLNIESIMQKANDNHDSNMTKAMYFLLAAIDDEYKAQNTSQEKSNDN